MRSVMFAAALAVVGSAAFASEQAFHARWERLASTNKAGAMAALDFLSCNTHWSAKLAAREDFVPTTLRSIEMEAAEAGQQCQAEEGVLAAAIAAGELQQLKAIVLRINAEAIVRIRDARDRPWKVSDQ